MMDSGSNIGGRDPSWKYYTNMEGNRNSIVCNYYGLVIKSGGITRFISTIIYESPLIQKSAKMWEVK